MGCELARNSDNDHHDEQWAQADIKLPQTVWFGAQQTSHHATYCVFRLVENVECE